MAEDEPIEIYTVNNPMVAELIHNAIEAEGIQCEINGESQGGFAGVLDVIQIMVHASDKDQALAIIGELEKEHELSTGIDEGDESAKDDEPPAE